MATAPDPGCKYVIGIDVGSTTVKMAVVDPTTLEILWSKYLRHETRQPEMTREMLATSTPPSPTCATRTSAASSPARGGSPIAPQHGRQVRAGGQRRDHGGGALHPDVGSVIELGGQDAKIIMFREPTRSPATRPPRPR
jgi:hypothetical protein